MLSAAGREQLVLCCLDEIQMSSTYRTRNTQLCGKYMGGKVLERGKKIVNFSPFLNFDDINFRFSAGDKFSLLIFEGVTSWQDP